MPFARPPPRYVTNSSTTDPAHRIEHIDGLRGLAALIVVLTHFFAAFYPYTIFGSGSLRHTNWGGILLYPPLGLLVAGHFAVCLFFLLSGYVLAAPLLARDTPWRDIVAAIIKRPVRLIGIVLATTLIAWVLRTLNVFQNHAAAQVSGSVWFESFWAQPAPAPLVLAKQLLTQPFTIASAYNQPMWSIKRELLGSFLVYGILLFGQLRLIRWGLMLGAAYWFAGNFYQCFIIGLIIAEVRSWRFMRGTSIRLPAWLSVLLMVIVIICGSYPKYAVSYSMTPGSYWFAPPLNWLGGGWSMLAAIALFLLVLHAPSAQWLLTRRPVQFLGKVSYSMYGLHFLILGSISASVFVACQPYTGYSGAAFMALTSLLLVTLLGAKVLHETVDRAFIVLSRGLGSYVRSLLTTTATRP